MAIWHQSFCDLIDFFRLLTLASPLAEDHVAPHIVSASIAYITLASNQTSLLSVLQIVAMPIGSFASVSLLTPGELIHQLVAIALKHVKSHSVLGVDYPDKKVAVSLELVPRNVHYRIVFEGSVGRGNPSDRGCCGELPWRVRGNHIEKPASVFDLVLCQTLIVKHRDICADRDCPESVELAHGLQLFELLVQRDVV